MDDYYEYWLKPVPPFRLDLTAWALRRRPENLIDRWDGQTYERVLMVDGEPILVAVNQIGDPENTQLKVVLNGKGVGPQIAQKISVYLERLLGIQIDLSEFYLFSQAHPNLESIINQFRGIKPPRFPTLFETLANAIACQQLSLNVGIQLLNRLTMVYGAAFQTDHGIFHAFPNPQDLVGVELEELRNLGYSYQKGRYLLNLAGLLTAGQLVLEDLEVSPDSYVVENLCEIKGIGRWTAEYFLLRGLGRTNIFPGDDIGARNSLKRWLELPYLATYADVHLVLADWKNYAGMVYFHLLLKSLSEKGIISV